MTHSSPQLDLVFARRQDRTIIERRLFRWPFVLTRTFALDRIPASMLTAIVQTSSGALHGDDRLEQRLLVRSGAAAHITTQGAASVHRAGPDLETVETIRAGVEAGGILEYCPEPRILFPGAALEQRIEIDCAPGGVAFVSDGFTTHDPEGRGRGFRRFASTSVLRCGEADPVLVDRFDLRGPLAPGPARFAAFGAVLIATPGRTQGTEVLADALSAALAAIPELYGAASPLPGVATGLGLRLAGRDLRALRAGLHAAWVTTRRHLHGVPPPPRRKGDDVPS